MMLFVLITLCFLHKTAHSILKTLLSVNTTILTLYKVIKTTTLNRLLPRIHSVITPNRLSNFSIVNRSCQVTEILSRLTISRNLFQADYVLGLAVDRTGTIYEANHEALDRAESRFRKSRIVHTCDNVLRFCSWHCRTGYLYLNAES